MGGLRQETDPAGAGLDPVALDRLDRFAGELVDRGRLPGFLLAVARGGRVAHLTTGGRRDLAAGLPVRADTLWRIYSMTKPVLAVAVLRLAEEGRLSLDDPVARHLPAFAEPRVHVGGEGGAVRTRPAEGPLLIRQLLTHTAGLTFGSYHAHPVDALYRAAGIASSSLAGGDLAETVDAYARLPLQFEPGTRWNYSVGSNVLGRIAEVVTGQPLDVCLAERVLRPLGMTDTGFQVSPEQADRLAELYGERDDGTLVPVPGPPVRERPRFLSAGSGLVSSARDFHRFTRMLRGGGQLDGVRVLSAASVASMTSNHLPGGAELAGFGTPVHRTRANEGLGFGLHVSVVRDPARTAAPSGRGTYGWTGVATTAFWVNPEHDLTVLFFSQAQPRDLKVFPTVRRLVHEAIVS
ncbi:beta-lactamase family protein [Streptomyces sp. J2-1]|uniref:serine hydrolase domain-containing protein n=1 Tax=Streptomyces corallincola TaxID=2851888 RepID=UPI001C37E763|nr:serine hydrolase domain-containing protein [Streptomyces corallincola]MBV2358005.1 beta-lactamase family protein [Streptomyces corallincola]